MIYHTILCSFHRNKFKLQKKEVEIDKLEG